MNQMSKLMHTALQYALTESGKEVMIICRRKQTIAQLTSEINAFFVLNIIDNKVHLINNSTIRFVIPDPHTGMRGYAPDKCLIDNEFDPEEVNEIVCSSGYNISFSPFS